MSGWALRHNKETKKPQRKNQFGQGPPDEKPGGEKSLGNQAKKKFLKKPQLKFF